MPPSGFSRIAAKPLPGSAGGRRYEVAIPWAQLAPFQPAAGANLGMTMILNEDDGDGRAGFMGWFSEYGQVVYIFMQMGFWVIVGIAAAIAASKYAQFVDFTTGKSAAKAAAKAAVKSDAAVAGSPAFADDLGADE